ncbi:MAG TPA: ATP-binding protein [Paraburkholderia sp.]|jgi:chemotaxis family two-component system sensor kinase Cph1|nr:ATP-binding protein [Paraburkholderia sp.]
MANVYEAPSSANPTATSAETDCAREPIHIPGGIQPHGYLISVDDAGRMVQVSANLAELAGAPASSLLGQPLSQVLGDAAALCLNEVGTQAAPGAPRFICAIDDPRAATHGAAGHAPLAVVAHRHDGVTIVELEPAKGTADVFSSVYPLVQTFLRELGENRTIDQLAQSAANEIKRITGYGRTLVYSFDDAGNGHVIGEALDASYPSYLDQHFPGSDIPPQARALYVLNRIRLIADADYQPVPLVPAMHPATGRPTDLTWSSLRSVSPVHVQYMKNMGTWSSMSMSIVVRGRLWGLISCHHATPRLPAFETRAACEYIAQMLSLQIEAKEDRAQAEYRLELRDRLSRLVTAMTDSERFVDALATDAQDLLGLADAAGAAIVFDGQITQVGLTPDASTIERLVAWLDGQSDEVYATDAFAHASGEPVNPDAAGILAVSISKLFRNYVIWFRPEVVRALKWAGDPRSKLASLSSRLSPRESFDVWTETVRGRSLPWHAAELEIAMELRTALLGIVLRRAEQLAQLALELSRANEELEGFSYTVSHDLRAPLRHIAGFADLLRDMEADKLSERGRHFVERIIGSARFGGRLVDDLLAFSQMGRAALRIQPVDLATLVSELVAEQQRDHPERAIEWRVSSLCTITADAVLIQVVMRNLIDNAVKFTGNRVGENDSAIIEVGCETGRGELADHDVVFVRDNGVGFDPKYMDKLFGVFQRLHRFEEFEGTGIGLASVKRIIERHGGKTWARAQLDHGATLFVALPRRSVAPDLQARETPAAAVARIASVSTHGRPFRNVRKPSE